MRIPAHPMAAALAVAALCAFCTPASATSQRTFVASFGIDTGTCTAPSPCRSFGFAITQTSAGGEVVVVDTAGYGPVTIGKAVTLVAPPGVYAGVTVTSGDGITISAGANDDVALRGLTINGAGGGRGIVVTSAASVHVDNVVVNGFSTHGIDVSPTVSVDVFINDSVVRNVANGLNFEAQNAAAFGTRVQISRLRVQNCAGLALTLQDIERTSIVDSVFGACTAGIVARGGALSSTNPSVAIDRTLVADNTGDGVTANASVIVSVVNVSHSVAFGNGTGIHAGANGQLRVYFDQITANGLGTTVNSGTVNTLQNNFRGGNANGDGDAMTPDTPN